MLQDIAWHGDELCVSGLLVAPTSRGWATTSFLSSKTHSVGKHGKHPSWLLLLQVQNCIWLELTGQKGYGKSPLPKDYNQLKLCGHGVRVVKQANRFCSIALTARMFFSFRYCVRHISQPADTIRWIPVSGRYWILHQYKRHATFKTREKGGRHPAFKLQCRIPDTGESNWNSLYFFFNMGIPINF